MPAQPSGGWITPFGDKTPTIHPSAYVDVSTRIIGDVEVEEGVSIWPMSVLRADSAPIRICRRAAVLDLALLEAPEGHPITVGEEAIVSHGAKIHGAKIESRALVGIGAIVLDGAVISSGSIIGSGSLVTPGTVIPPNSLVLGVPAKIVRQTTEADRENILRQVEELYSKSRLLKGL
jgi:carbonic anhydrase/acetyltransferase-like protein (isoleucine patch superfamily)